ncbi:MAG: dihydrolipoyl dehydrogenase [Gemmatimonadetes bacterium]|nr:MAG: dihydrolipoyl dehydrogenase [Gemmatimonadota bacterium]
MIHETKKTQLVVIGGGPGGYAAAFLAADMGMQVTLIDLEQNPGGVCLYRGCIPSKALLHVAKLLRETREAAHWGVTFTEPQIDLDQLRAWKESVVTKLTGGLGQLSKQRHIDFIQGRATLLNDHTLLVERKDGSDETLFFDYAILATGSQPARIPIFPDSPRIWDSTDALRLESIPKRLLVVGGGYIGLEMATVYSALGSEVTVVEMLPQLLTGADSDLVKILEKRLKIQLNRILKNTKVIRMVEESDGLVVKLQGQGGSETEEKFDAALVSVGRKPNSTGIGLENTRIKVDDQGFVEVDQQLRTAEPRIFAIGDLVGQPMLAHKASHEGRVAVEVIAGHKVIFDPAAIPGVVFTDPEVAWCGLTETEAREKGIPIEVAKFPWGASGRALTLDRLDGLTKLIIEPETERILGVGIVGAGAGELIAEGTLAVEMAALASDLKLTIHPHPTLSETVMESAEVFFGQSTHVYRPKKK